MKDASASMRSLMQLLQEWRRELMKQEKESEPKVLEKV